jgi:hypothetical protein
MISRRSATLFLLAVLVFSACERENQPVILEIMELRSDASPERRVWWRSSSEAAPGTVIRIRGHQLVHIRREVTVRIGKHPCPVIKRDDHAVVCMVPPMAPGTSTVTITTPGSAVSRPIVVLRIPRLGGTPGDVTRRFLDEVESLLAQRRQHLEHPARRLSQDGWFST